MTTISPPPLANTINSATHLKSLLNEKIAILTGLMFYDLF